MKIASTLPLFFILLIAGPTLSQDLGADARRINKIDQEIKHLYNGTANLTNTIAFGSRAVVQSLKSVERLEAMRKNDTDYLLGVLDVDEKKTPDSEVPGKVQAANQKFSAAGHGAEMGQRAFYAVFHLMTLDDLRKKNAEAILKDSNSNLSMTFNNTRQKVTVLSKVQRNLNLGRPFAAVDSGILSKFDSLGKEVATQRAEALKREIAEVANVRWPGGDTGSAVASRSGRVLKTDPNWGGNGTKILKVTSHGSWAVAERTFLGTPASYGHPIYVAAQNPGDPPELVTVYKIRAVTEGPSQSSPIDGFWVGDSFRMLTKNLP